MVDGKLFYEFRHRLPLQMVTHLQVDGDLELQSINFLGGQPVPPQVCEPPSLSSFRDPCPLSLLPAQLL
jgi:galectin-4